MRKTFKGLFVVELAFVLLLGLTGCGAKENGGENAGTQGGSDNGLYSIKDSDIDVDSGFDISMVPSVIKKRYWNNEKI